MPLFEQVQIRDEGIVQGFVMTIDFVGAGVSAVVSGGVATVTISGGGNTIYSGDGTIAGPRAIALNGNAVAFNQGAEPFFKIDPTVGAENTFIRAFNTTGADNYGRVVASTANTNGQVLIQSSFNGGAQAASITVFADTTSGRIAYSALTHTFTGTIAVSSDAQFSTANNFVWGSQTYGGGGDIPQTVLFGSLKQDFTLCPSWSDNTAGEKLILSYIGSGFYSAWEIANVASGFGTSLLMKSGGNVGIGVSSATARLMLPAGSATANTAPLKMTSGTLLGTTEAGAIEYDGTHLYFTAANAGTRYQLDQQSGGGGWGTTGTIATLTGSSVVDLAGNDIEFQQGGDAFLVLDPTSFQSTLSGRDGTANSFFRVRGNSAGSVDFMVSANDGVNQVTIEGDAVANAISYTADTHTFNVTNNFEVGDGANNVFSISPSSFNAGINVGDGTASGVFTLVGNSSGDVKVEAQVNDGIGFSSFSLNSNAGDGYFFEFISNDGTNAVSIQGDAVAQTITLTAVNTIVSNLAGTGSRAVLADATGTLSAPISDFSVKENVMDLTYGLDVLSKLRPVSFTFKDDWKRYGEGMQIGFIAQDIELILPNSVFTTPSNGKMGYNESDIIPILVKAVQDQQAHIERLQKQITG